MSEPTLTPTSEQLQRLMEAPDTGPVVMLNLLRYADQANDGSGRTGRDAYMDYGALVTPMVEARGGSFLVFAAADETVIGPADEEWDDMVLVQYPSRAAFIDMITNTEYLAAHVHREAGLADSRLVATTRIDGA
jgi:uncharacterized protein (DUF1330 family)